MEEFSVGDTVALVTGSAPAVVTEVVDDSTVIVAMGVFDSIEYHQLDVSVLDHVDLVDEDEDEDDEEDSDESDEDDE